MSGWGPPPGQPGQSGQPGQPPNQPGQQMPPPGGYWGAPQQYQMQPRHARGGSGRMLGIVIGGLLGVAVLAAVIILANAPTPPTPPCQPGESCGGPPVSTIAPGASPSPGSATPRPTGSGPTPGPGQTPAPTPISNAPPVITGELWQSDDLGFGFEYDAGNWTLSDESGDRAVLDSNYYDARAWIIGADASTSPQELMDQMLGELDQALVGRAANDRNYDAVLGPSIGYIRGKSSVYSATIVDSNGSPLAPVGLTMLASTDGRITVCFALLVGNPDDESQGETAQHWARSDADALLKTFDWGPR